MRNRCTLAAVLICALTLSAAAEETMKTTSSAFADGSKIPEVYSCKGADVSPPLAWSGVPEGAASLALICDDPDAPMGTWVHWVYFDLPPHLEGLPQDVPAGENPEVGGVQGRNSWRRSDYGGPCPPGGTHRYYFKLYALDVMLDLGPAANKRRVLKAMEGHILAEAQLMGTFSK